MKNIVIVKLNKAVEDFVAISPENAKAVSEILEQASNKSFKNGYKRGILGAAGAIVGGYYLGYGLCRVVDFVKSKM